MNLIEYMSNANCLVDAFREARKGSDWKESVQRYEMNLLLNVLKSQKAIRDGTYSQLPFVEFVLNERGKSRPIKSIHISDRVVQRSLCDNILTPAVKNKLIYDNGASIKGKGISFARDRLDKHIHSFYRKHGRDGYILLIDFSKFFDNIPHDKLLNMFGELVQDNEMTIFIQKVLNEFAIDVSYMSEYEYSKCMSILYSDLEHRKIPKNELTSDRFMNKSVGIGSQISQIAGVLYPTAIDNYCKCVKSIKYYGRYMDDIYVIHGSKEYLYDLLAEIKKIANTYGLFINDKKTQIIKLSRGFTFLQVKYFISPTGKVIKKLKPKAFTRERRRLKKYKSLMDQGKIQYKDIHNAYMSWRGNAKHFYNHEQVMRMDKLYNELFIGDFHGRERT